MVLLEYTACSIYCGLENFSKTRLCKEMITVHELPDLPIIQFTKLIALLPILPRSISYRVYIQYLKLPTEYISIMSYIG